MPHVEDVTRKHGLAHIRYRREGDAWRGEDATYPVDRARQVVAEAITKKQTAFDVYRIEPAADRARGSTRKRQRNQSEEAG